MREQVFISINEFQIQTKISIIYYKEGWQIDIINIKYETIRINEIRSAIKKK